MNPFCSVLLRHHKVGITRHRTCNYLVNNEVGVENSNTEYTNSDTPQDEIEVSWMSLMLIINRSASKQVIEPGTSHTEPSTYEKQQSGLIKSKAFPEPERVS